MVSAAANTLKVKTLSSACVKGIQRVFVLLAQGISGLQFNLSNMCQKGNSGKLVNPLEIQWILILQCIQGPN